MTALAWMLGRLVDFLHERRIADLALELRMNELEPHHVRLIMWEDLRRAIGERSPEQVRRMEKAKGLIP